MNLLRNEQQESYDKQKSVILVKKREFESNILKIKKILKFEIIAIIQVNMEMLHIIYVI